MLCLLKTCLFVELEWISLLIFSEKIRNIRTFMYFEYKLVYIYTLLNDINATILPHLVFRLFLKLNAAMDYNY